jgi:HEAT repeat protein
LSTLDFIRKVVVWLCSQFSGERTQADPEHMQLAAALTVAAQSVSMFDDFDTALRAGLEMDRVRQGATQVHQKCCAEGLDNLLAPAAVQKVIELAVSRNREPAQSRTISALLRLIENPAAEVVFQMLEDERNASTRSKLLHISRQLGPGSFEAATKRLQDERWYVVRNACYVLGALGDPDAIALLMPAFSHSDVRVKEAALTALLKSNIPNRGKALVTTLHNLPQHLQESALAELILQRDPSIIEPLGEFLRQPPVPKLSLLEKAAQALAALEDDKAAAALTSLVSHFDEAPTLKRAVITAMNNSPYNGTRKKAIGLR